MNSEPRTPQNKAELVLGACTLLTFIVQPYAAPVVMLGGILGIEHYYGVKA